MAILKYTLRRTGASVPALIGVVTLVFILLRVIPGDAATAIGGEYLSEEALQGLRERMGLAEPVTTQFLNYIGGVLTFDLGESLLTNIPVRDTVLSAVPVTFTVAIASVLVGTLIAVPLGTYAAYCRYRGRNRADSAMTTGTMVVDTLPNFWVALILMLVFSLHLQWFPISGPLDWGDPIYMMKRLALPIVVLGAAQIASTARITRTAVLQALEEDHIRTARSLGESERSILIRHALPNAALPIITIIGMSVGRLFGGTVVTESVFSIPGMGTQLLNGIYRRDYPVVQGLILVYALIFVMVNIVTDVIYTRVDPRVRLD